jgi:uncharacterized protein YndB with AHSA1/START domain
MADIIQDFTIKAASDRVWLAVSTPEGLDRWWTKRSGGEPRVGAEYQLWFGPNYDWRATVTRCVENREFELRMVTDDPDWNGTQVGFRLEAQPENTWAQFYHTGWPSPNEHYRISCHCWALYLRLLRRNLEHGELVPYEQRLDA